MFASMLLASTDESLIQNVEEAVSSVSNCGLQVLANLNTSEALLDSIALVVIHQTETIQETAILRFLQSIRAAKRPVAVVVISEKHDPGQAVNLLRAGAADYLTRPVNIGRLTFLINVLTVRARYARDSASRPQPTEKLVTIGTDQSFMYSCSDKMTDIVEQIRTLAPLETTVLLTGETGTGKNRVAKLIHEMSPRSKEPFLAINCGALSPTLVEGEMFGHVKGAFTGADQDRAGKFSAAGAGTLLLDEIDSLSLNSQSKLLRAVDERVFEPVGSNRELPLRARLIVATNKCLEDEVAAGRIRSDLYYRLHVVSLHILPLRERATLIVPLANKLAAEFAARNRCSPPVFSSGVLDAMQAYDWPGNIRELKNFVERAVSLFSGRLFDVNDLSSAMQRFAPRDEAPAENGAPTSKWFRTKAQSEMKVIVNALARHSNNRSRAAEELGISRVTLYKKLRKYQLI
jgi:DNA-binding NtrC family response regulator